MEVIGIILGLSAAITWAVASLVAHRPVTHFGTFSFVQIQLPTSALLLCIIVTFIDGWTSISFLHLNALIISGFVGILLGDLCLHKCLEIGGPRRMQVLFALNAPIAGVLGFLFLDEILSFKDLIAGLLMFSGVIMAIVFVSSNDEEDNFEQLRGSLWLVVFWGLSAALCQAVGLVAIKPVIDDGTSPLTASAFRTLGSAIIILSLAIHPRFRLKKISMDEIGVFVQCVVAGWMGYALAMSLLLIALIYHNTGIVAIMGATVPVVLLPIIWATTARRPPFLAWLGALLVVFGTSLIII